MALQTTALPETSAVAYRHARADHYLRRAENRYQMGRFSAALKVLEQLLETDPQNPAAHGLREKTLQQLRLLQSRSESSKGPRGRGRGDVVLIVDQDQSVLIRLSDRLRRYGFNPVSAIDLEEAQRTIEQVCPSLVISEVNFAEGPAGFELFHWLRSRETTRSIPFLFHATRIDRELLIAGKRLGVDDFLFKPADEEVVVASVSNCLMRARTL